MEDPPAHSLLAFVDAPLDACSSVSPAHLTCWQGKTEDGGEAPMNVGVFADKTNLADSPVRACGKYVE